MIRRDLVLSISSIIAIPIVFFETFHVEQDLSFRQASCSVDSLIIFCENHPFQSLPFNFTLEDFLFANPFINFIFQNVLFFLIFSSLFLDFPTGFVHLFQTIQYDLIGKILHFRKKMRHVDLIT